MKKRRINAKLAYATLGLAGVGIACTVLPMLPFTISVSQSDIANAVRAGVSKSQAPNAAFLKNLDAAGEKVMGAAAWRETSFVGNVRYSSLAEAPCQPPGSADGHHPRHRRVL